MIYLASTSPRRKKLLKEKGLSFRTINPSYEEKNERGAPPAALVEKHALEKAMSCIPRIRQGKVIGSDTIVYCGGKIIGKPKNRRDAFRILSGLQGRWHTVYTGVAILEVKKREIVNKKIFSEKTKVRLKKMNTVEIERYFKKINPLDKAGAYAIQSKHTNIISQVKGSLTNAMGLPTEALKKFL